MRALALVAAALCVALPAPAWSQAGTGKPAAPSPAEVTRYMTIYGEMMGELASDAIWRETRQGNRVTSAELDVCHSVTATSNRKDRFVVTLRPENGKLVGSGQSEPDKVPVQVSLTRRRDGETFAIEGTITRGGKVEQVAASDLTDMSEQDFREQQGNNDEIVRSPANFFEVSPISLAVRVSREAFVPVVNSLRGRNARVDYASLVQNCADLRAGSQLVRIETAPEQAAALVAELKAMPGVLVAGWTTGSYGVERAVRVNAAEWRDGATLKRDALATRIGAVMAGVLAATPDAAKWDEVTHELTLTFKRPDQAARGLGLTELIEVTLLVGPEATGNTDSLLIWIGESSVEPRDESAGPRLAFDGSDQSSDEETTAVELDSLLAGLAKELKGQLWDSDTSGWK